MVVDKIKIKRATDIIRTPPSLHPARPSPDRLLLRSQKCWPVCNSPTVKCLAQAHLLPSSYPHRTMSHPSSRFRNRRPSTQYSRAALRPHFVFIPHSRSGRSGILQSQGSHFTTYKWSVPAGGGGGVSHSHYCYIERSRTHARPHTLCTTSLAPGSRVLVQADARSRPPNPPSAYLRSPGLFPRKREQR